jgi:hypothetical protein
MKSAASPELALEGVDAGAGETSAAIVTIWL